MLKLFNRNPYRKMILYRDRADRAAIAYLEALAVKGTITRPVVAKVADLINRDPRQLVRMIPDLRRRRRHEKAMAGLRNAGLLNHDYDSHDLIEQ